MTISEKILAGHSEHSSVTPGEFVEASIDRAMVHEALGVPGGVGNLQIAAGQRHADRAIGAVDEEILVAINLSNRRWKTIIDLPWADYSPLQDLLNPGRQIRSPIQESKLVISLDAFACIVGKRLPPRTMEPPQGSHSK